MSNTKKLSREDIEHIAKLARIDLSEKEKEVFCEQLSDVLNYMEILNEVDTQGVIPTTQVTGLVNVTRRDEVCPADPETVQIIKEVPGISSSAIREKMISAGDWKSQVPKAVAEVVIEIDGAQRIRHL